MARNLDMSLIRTFVAVAEHASMTSAGNALHLTQGAVSQQVKRLEDMLGCRLIVRDRRRLRLTPSGERLLGKARHLLGLNDEIWSEMSTHGIEGKVRLGVPYDLMGTIMAPMLKAYGDAFPQVDLSLSCASSHSLTGALMQGEIDLAIAEAPVGQSESECLSVERLVWVGAKSGRAHLKEPLPVSLVADTCAFRPVVLDALNVHKRAWRAMFESESIEATTATVRADLAVTVCLSSTVPTDLEILPSDAGLPQLPPFSINLHLPRSGGNTAILEMARHIRDALGSSTWQGF